MEKVELAEKRHLNAQITPYENPRVSVAVTHMNGKSFAEALDRAIAGSKSPLPLSAPKTIEHSSTEMKGPMSRLYRRYRW
jgi:hypothetical protein